MTTDEFVAACADMTGGKNSNFAKRRYARRSAQLAARQGDCDAVKALRKGDSLLKELRALNA